MKLYLQIIKNTWAEYMMYRLNFIMWRVRMVLQVLIVYFLWLAIYASQPGEKALLFGYSQDVMLTYILFTSIMRTLVFSTTTMNIGDVINQGNLSNFLVRPLNFFSYYFARDIGDKALNFVFALGEMAIIIALLKPPIVVQSSPVILLLFAGAVGIGMVLYFYFSLLLGFLGFWTPDVWGPRFISIIVMEFFTGAMFPLDILPQPLYAISKLLPFSYLLYFPLSVYTGKLSTADMIAGFCISMVWIGIFMYGVKYVWKRGLQEYTAEGK